VLVIPSLDLTAGRSRVVFWPGAASGTGAPTDRPEVIAARFVEQGARVLHLVDFDGARQGRPANLDAVSRIAARVAVPLQLAGGLDGPEQIRIAFAAGATRVVLSMAAADDPATLRECLAVAGDWLAVGIDPRPDRFAAFPWRRSPRPTFEDLASELAGAGVRRLVLSHGGVDPDAALIGRLARDLDLEVLVAGGIVDLAGIRRLREAGAAGVILGEALLAGRIEYPDALEAAA
jgi:phosphoribosylformimino-5-aminoimidazole carboxamide ribotide isomerase